MNLLWYIPLCVLPHLSTAMFSSGDAVVELTPDNIDQMMKSRDLWFIEFYAPWCGHCQSFAPEYKKAAQALKGVVRLGAIDMDKHRSLGAPYGIQGFPTVKIFGSNKNQPLDYQGGRTADAVVSAAMSHLQKLVQSRLGGEDQSQSGGGQSNQGGSGGDGEVIELTDANFEKTVIQSDDMWLVEFYAPWCGHCKNLKPHWDKAARELGGKVKLGALDATVHNAISSRYGIQGFPTIKFFAAGAKDGQAAEFDGGRTADDIVRWALDKVADSVPPPEVVQVTEQKHLKDACESRQLCIISILPHILDSQSAGRNKYLEVLQELGNKYKKNMWGWVWAEGGAQMKLEESLGIGGFGYPAMAALNARKMKFAPLRGPFTLDGINEFLRALSMGRGRTEAMKNNELATIVKTEPWDGKDAKPPVEEEIDLSDLDLDSSPKKEEL